MSKDTPEQRRATYLKYRESKLAKQKARYAEDAEFRARIKSYRTKNRARIREYEKKRRQENIDAMRAADRERFRKKIALLSQDPVSLKRYRDRVNLSTRWHKLKRYGLSPEVFSEMFKSQNGLCRICGLLFDFSSGNATPHIDHDHLTGDVRGLLCARCNTGIGMLQDDPTILRAAIDYLEKAECQSKG